MGTNTPRDGAPGTTDQSPRWEGPEETRPRGYLPAKDNPDVDRDAVGENNRDERNRPSDALKTRDTPNPEKDARVSTQGRVPIVKAKARA